MVAHPHKELPGARPIVITAAIVIKVGLTLGADGDGDEKSLYNNHGHAEVPVVGSGRWAVGGGRWAVDG